MRPSRINTLYGSIIGRTSAVLAAIMLCACSRPIPSKVQAKSESQPAVAAQKVAFAAPPPAEPAPPPAPDPDLLRDAQVLVSDGKAAYRQGDYATAEAALKEAIMMYPFLPEANLVLGKILLIRGSAEQDQALLNNARLMFEMAAALDPNAREAKLLLELFRAGNP